MSLLKLARKIEARAWKAYALASNFDKKLLAHYNRATEVRQRLELKEKIK